MFTNHVMTKEFFIYFFGREAYKVWFEKLNESMIQFDINTKSRVCAFLGQVYFDSLRFHYLEENFNYSKDRLLELFPHKFNDDNVNEFVHHPEKIANTIYANIYGNGDYESGDGWRFRPRGLIKIVGKNSYDLCQKNLKFESNLFTDNPDLVSDSIDYACMASASHFESQWLNTLADKEDFKKISQILNTQSLILIESKIQISNMMLKYWHY